MRQPCVLIVEADIVVRHPLADYLRACGYRVLEAIDAAETRLLLSEGAKQIDSVLVDIAIPGESGFALAGWIRTNHPGIDVILAGTVVKATEKAGALCEEGPAVAKPYDHKLVLDHIRRLQAARDRKK